MDNFETSLAKYMDIIIGKRRTKEGNQHFKFYRSGAIWGGNSIGFFIVEVEYLHLNRI